jgi:hypothetical protein
VAQTSFYNDNEYRAYPFVYRSSYPGAALPDATILDAGIIMGLDSEYDPAEHSVWLASIARAGGSLQFTFATDAPGAATTPLVFSCPDTADDWRTAMAESDPSGDVLAACDPAPVWEGFLVTGPLTDLLAQLAPNTSLTFQSGVRLLEPGRIQSLVRGYLRSINVGNFARTRALPPTACADGEEQPDPDEVVVNATCMSGNIRIKEGYNCQLRQVARTNELNFSAQRGAGDTVGAELCAHGGELPLYDDEPFDPQTGFYSGGAACNQVIAAVNGVGGPNISFVGGTGVVITADPTTNSVKIALAQDNIVGNCGT